MCALQSKENGCTFARKIGALLAKKNGCTSSKEKWVHFKDKKMDTLQSKENGCTLIKVRI